MQPVLIAALYVVVVIVAGLMGVLTAKIAAKLSGRTREKFYLTSLFGDDHSLNESETSPVHLFTVAALFVLFIVAMMFVIPLSIALHDAARAPLNHGSTTVLPDAWRIMVQMLVFGGIAGMGLGYAIACGAPANESTDAGNDSVGETIIP